MACRIPSICRMLFLVGGFVILPWLDAHAQSFSWGGSVRGYQFVRFEEGFAETRRDTELGILRLTAENRFTGWFSMEAHAVLQLLSPPLQAAARIASSSASGYLPLEHRFLDRRDPELVGSLDRLNLRLERSGVRAIVGRQAITWGVSYFWPAMDLFVPFAPERIDRDYKPGVDAIRIAVPLSAFSEIEIIGGILGRSPATDGAAAALTRIHLGSSDLGLMAGKFHGDTVAGAFLTSNLRGTGLRLEGTWTRSGDAGDRELDRSRFWRGSIGIDRQLSSEFLLTVELSFNGFGASGAEDYLKLAAADRFRRGEVNALGKLYAAMAGTWQMHPLWIFSNALLLNANDPSALWIPSLVWSTGNNSELLIGGQVGIGRRPGPGAVPLSEYGSVPASVFVGVKAYF